MLKKLLKKIKKEGKKVKKTRKKREKKAEIKEEPKKYSNRFLKFYYLNKKRLNKERRSLYHKKKKKGTCIRCKRKAVPGIIFCDYHRSKIKGYNKKARGKKR